MLGGIKMEVLETEYGIFTNNEVEGQTAQEVYQDWLNDNFDLIDGQKVPKQIDICPTKTMEERVEELEQENELLKQENHLLHTQVEATTQNQEFIESCVMEMAQVVYA